MDARPMRRKDRKLNAADTEAILAKAEYGVLSLLGDGGAPYGVPLSFIWMEGCIYFHCAREGCKIDCLRAEPRVSFAAVDGVHALFDDGFTTNYQSAIITGRAEEVVGEEEKRSALLMLCEKYLPEHFSKAQAYIDKSAAHTGVWKIVCERITGKARG